MFFAALILGFTGSIHCIGMCSPLAMAVTNFSKRAWLNRLLYNSGRIFTYSLLGLAAASADSLLPVSQYQNLISIFLGVILLVMGVAGISGIRLPFITEAIIKLISFLKKVFAYYLQKRNAVSTLMMGMINGFLPCGLTFIALMFCLTLPGPWEGFIYMLLFGLGTLPAMLGVSAFINPLIKKFHWNISYVMTVLLITSGCLLIGRALVSHTHDADNTNKEDIVVCR